MKRQHSNLLTVIAFASFCLLFSCQKKQDVDNPTPEPQPNGIERQVTVKLKNQFVTTRTVEFILTDSSGNIIVDTLVPVEQWLDLKFRSNESKYNVTLIEFSNITQKYTIATSYQVNPDNWYMGQGFIRVRRPEVPSISQGSTITHFNVPSIPTQPVGTFYYQFGNASPGNWDPINHTIILDYRRPNPFYSFLLIPSLRKYKFHDTKSNSDSVDCTQMETALTLNYKKGFEVTDSVRIVEGYRKKDDYSTYIPLWSDFYENHKALYDIMYPPTGVEQYFIQYYAFDKKGNEHYSQCLSDKVPTTMEFLDDSYYSIIKKDTNDFEIKFLKSITGYGISFLGDNYTWSISLPAEKTNLKGTTKLIDLNKTKLLKDIKLSPFKSKFIGFTKADNYSLNEFHNIIMDPLQSQSILKVKNYMVYSTEF